MTPEKPKRALCVEFGLEPRPQLHENDPRKREERTKFATGGGKTAKFSAVRRRGGPAQAGLAEGRSCRGVVQQKKTSPQTEKTKINIVKNQRNQKMWKNISKRKKNGKNEKQCQKSRDVSTTMCDVMKMTLVSANMIEDKKPI